MPPALPGTMNSMLYEVSGLVYFTDVEENQSKSVNVTV